MDELVIHREEIVDCSYFSHQWQHPARKQAPEIHPVLATSTMQLLTGSTRAKYM